MPVWEREVRSLPSIGASIGTLYLIHRLCECLGQHDWCWEPFECRRGVYKRPTTPTGDGEEQEQNRYGDYRARDIDHHAWCAFMVQRVHKWSWLGNCPSMSFQREFLVFLVCTYRPFSGKLLGEKF